MAAACAVRPWSPGTVAQAHSVHTSAHAETFRAYAEDMPSAQTATLLELPVGPVAAGGAARALQTAMARFTNGPSTGSDGPTSCEFSRPLIPRPPVSRPANSPGACSDGVLDALHRRSSACWTASLSWQPDPT